MNVTEKSRENRVRRLAGRQGCLVRKDRGNLWRLGAFNHCGGYMLIDADRNWIVAGERFDLDLDDLERMLTAEEKAS